jgi:hypothetical protein
VVGVLFFMTQRHLPGKYQSKRPPTVTFRKRHQGKIIFVVSMDYINPMLGNEAGQLPGVAPGEEFVSMRHGESRNSILLPQGLEPATWQPDTQKDVPFCLKFDAASVEVKFKSAKSGCHA